MNQLFVILVSVGLVVTFEAAFYAVRHTSQERSRDLKRRLQTVHVGGVADSVLLRAGRFARSASLDALLRDIAFAQRVENLLEQADSRMTVAQVCGYAMLGAISGCTLAIFGGMGLILAAVFGAIGGVTPFGLLVMTRDRRSHKLSEQLPEALDMMARSLRAGHATMSAFQIVATEMPEPASVEFGRAFEEQRLGMSLERAVVQMTQRLPANGDLKIFAVSTVIQKETGGNLAEILGNIAETIRARYRFYGKLRALTGEGRASAAVLGALPLLTCVAMQFMTPGYMTPLFVDPLGKIVLLGAITSWSVGLFTMYRMTKLDY